MRHDFFYASPQTSSSVNTTSHKQNNCMCLSLLIVTFCAAVCVRWAYCLLSPAIYPCACPLFNSSGVVLTDLFASPFPHPCTLIAVLFFSRAPSCCLLTRSRSRRVVSPAGPVLIHACTPFLSCSSALCAHTRPPSPTLSC
jgi:hypothetical protein